MAVTVAQSKAIAQAIRDKKYDAWPERKQQALRIVQEVNRRKNLPVVDHAQLSDKEQQRFEADQEGGIQFGRGIRSGFDAIGGTADVALTIANSAVVEPLAGLSGALAGAAVGAYKGDLGAGLDYGADLINDMRDALTFAPRLEGAERLLNGVASKLAYVDESADAVAEWAATPFNDSPFVQTLVYSTLLGLPDVFGVKGGKLMRLGTLNDRIKDIKKTANKLGINLKPNKFAASIIDSAENMTDGARAANAPHLQQALQEALEAKKLEAAAITKTASQTPRTHAFVSVDEAQKFSTALREELTLAGHELDKMPNVSAKLSALDNLHTRSPSAQSGLDRVVVNNKNIKVTVKKDVELPSRMIDRQIRDIEIIRNQVARRAESGSRLERTAFSDMKIKMDEWLDQQFHTDMIRGKPEDIAAWRDYHNARRAVNEAPDVGTDRIIKQLITRGATAEEIYRWTIGANKAGVPRAARVVDRIKELIGPDHPAIKGIRTDMMFEMAMPLFDSTKSVQAQMNGFIRNLDNMPKMNKSLFNSLDINKSAVTELRKFAEAAKDIEVNTSGLKRIARSATAFMFGHGIAKGGAIMRTLFSPVYLIMRGLAGQTLSAKKALLYNLVDANYATPALSLRGSAAGHVLEKTFRADWQEAASQSESE